MKFYLGTHMENWLDGMPGRNEIPLCVSNARLMTRKRLPIARDPWLLDSGAFTWLQKLGYFPFTPAEYVRKVRRYRWEVGKLEYCAPMDMMCEPLIINGGVANGVKFAGTHLSVTRHQELTVQNYVELMTLAPELPWMPVLQAWTRDGYRRCRDMYERAGIDLAALPRVGVGSICRRQATDEIEGIIRLFPDLQLHGFGVKTRGLRKYGQLLASADSLSWSFRGKQLPGCEPAHQTEANCLNYALSWRARLLASLECAEEARAS